MASGFRQSEKGMFGRGVYVSRDLQKASRFKRKVFQEVFHIVALYPVQQVKTKKGLTLEIELKHVGRRRL
ncbi:hypothetical protein AAFF_G00313570 [Aldrovandia affinis]|uniref:PARP catalytic domain-containing protein n=1 Tax=Aldrovandia affinis TaxID=143900 RepID=A0AAD7SNJ7_9TELE|nr:hypothetical protein AAFF_G00313570 [Aldrovandia affinis]